MDVQTFPYPARILQGDDVIAEYPAGTEYRVIEVDPDELRDRRQVLVIKYEGEPRYDLCEYMLQLVPPS
jgi:hypothetical protein